MTRHDPMETEQQAAERLTRRLDGMRTALTPLCDASPDLQAAIALIAPDATGWHYLTADRVGVVVGEPAGSRREISGDELNRAYACLAEVDPCELACNVLGRHPRFTAAELAAEIILTLAETPPAAPWHERILLESIHAHAVRLARLTLGTVRS